MATAYFQCTETSLADEPLEYLLAADLGVVPLDVDQGNVKVARGFFFGGRNARRSRGFFNSFILFFLVPYALEEARRMALVLPDAAAGFFQFEEWNAGGRPGHEY